MPIYEYSCEECGHFQQILVRCSKIQPTCKTCGSVRLERKVSASSFHLKGDGWYSSGYESAGGQSSATTEGK
jgi:putative FmdB family regulatory protein